jgi:glycosyltransferase involved in cell wall biosynthesis
LDSILQQSWRDYEIILVDDGSTDGSGEYERQYAQIDSRIKVFEYENAGVSMARNRGMDKAAGDYLMFIDADDYIGENYLGRVMAMTKQFAADIYVWGLTKKFPEGKVERLAPEMNGLLPRKNFLEQFVTQQYGRMPGPYGYVPNKVIKSQLVREHHLHFNHQLRLMEDYDFFLSCYAVCQNVCCFDETGYYYVTELVPASIRYTRNVNYPALVAVHQKCMKILKDNECLFENNRLHIQQAIDECTLSAYIELKPVTYKTLHALEEELPPLSNSFQSKKWAVLIYAIRKRNNLVLFFFLILWRTYICLRHIIHL